MSPLISALQLSIPAEQLRPDIMARTPLAKQIN
jgi:hypothetical protein